MDCYVKVEEEGRRRLRRSEGKGEPSPFLLLMDREEWKQKRGDYLKGEDPLGGRGPSRCCKVEWAGDCLTGVLRVPEIEKAGAFRLGMGFCLLPDRLVLIGEEGDVKGWVEGRLPALHQLQSPEHLLRELLEGLMGEDLLRLSQLTGGFLGNDENAAVQQISSAKLSAMEDILDSAVAEGQKLVIIARFLPEIRAICKELDGRGLRYACITGEVQDRAAQVAQFQNDPDVPVFVGQIATAGLGLTLTAASTMVFYSLDYSMSNYEQAKARIHRVGQRNPCTYIHLIAKGTVDEKVLTALRNKADLAKALVDDCRSGRNPFILEEPFHEL